MPIKKLSRGDFLKLKFEKNGNDISEKNRLIIVSVLGEGYGSMVSHFLFGNHVITQDSLEQILDRGYTLVTGELSAENFINLLGLPRERLASGHTPIERFINPGVGATDKEIREYGDVVKEMIEKNIAIGLTDTYTSEFSNLIAISPTYTQALTIAAGSLVSVGIGALIAHSIINKNKNVEVSRRSILKGLSLLIGGIIAGNTVFQSTQTERTRVFGERNENVEKAIEETRQFEETLEELGITKSDFVTYTEGMIDLRNLVMALNHWFIIGKYLHTKSLFVAGGAHGEAEDKFYEAPAKITSELIPFIDRLLTSTLDLLLQHDVDESIEDKDEFIANTIKAFATLFSWPIYLNSNPIIAEQDPEYFSAGELFIYKLKEQIEHLSQDPNDTNIQKHKILLKVKAKLIEDYCKKRSTLEFLYNKVKGSSFEIVDMDEVERDFFTDPIRKTFLFAPLNEFKRKELPVKWISSRTMILGYKVAPDGLNYIPILRHFKHNLVEGIITVTDSVRGPGGEKKVFKRYIYKKASPQDIKNIIDTQSTSLDSYCSTYFDQSSSSIKLYVHGRDDIVDTEGRDVYILTLDEDLDRELNNLVIVVKPEIS